MDEDEVDTIMKRREAQGRAQILEMVSALSCGLLRVAAGVDAAAIRAFLRALCLTNKLCGGVCRLVICRMQTSSRRRTCSLSASSTRSRGTKTSASSSRALARLSA